MRQKILGQTVDVIHNTADSDVVYRDTRGNIIFDTKRDSVDLFRAVLFLEGIRHQAEDKEVKPHEEK